MALFGKHKDSEDMKQTSEVKSASTDPSSAATSPFDAPPGGPGLPPGPPDTSSLPSNPPSINDDVFGAPPGASPGTQMQTPIDSAPPSDFNNPFANQGQSSPLDAPGVVPADSGINPGENPLEGVDASSFKAEEQSMNVSMPSMQNDNIFPSGVQNSSFSSKDEIQEMVDETVEKVIEERWIKLVEKVDKVASWKEKQEAHINLIKEDIVSLKEAFEKLEKRIMDKVGSYDRNILDVNSEIKALEKVFQKITPTLVNNVNELSKIAKDLKPEEFADLENTK